MALQPGAAAPDFTLPAGPEQTVTRSAYQGDEALLLLFFPAAYSGLCDEEMCTIGERHAAYEQLGARVLAVSVDSPWVVEKFARDTAAPFPILSDARRELIEAYDVRRDDLGGIDMVVAERAAFVIDPDGTVRWTWVGEHPGKLPPYDEIESVLSK